MTDDIVNPNSIRQIEKKGMPHYGNTERIGNLYVKFEVEFPKKFEMGNTSGLNKILPSSKKKENVEKSKCLILERSYREFKEKPAEIPKAKNKYNNYDSQDEDYDSENDDINMHGNNQCNQQ